MTGALPELLVFGREPSAGRVKTRLAEKLGPEEAAMLYAAFLEDLREALRSPAEWRAVLAHDGEAGPFLKGRFGQGWTLLPQGGGSLGERLARAFEESAGRGSPAAAAAGSDVPTLAAEDVRRAFGAVLRAGAEGSRADLAVSPSADGGFSLAALRAGVSPAPFLAPVRWSTEHALEDLLGAAKAAGLSVTLLRPVSDVDRVEDLAPLRRALDADPDRAPATARLLAAFFGGPGAGGAV